MFPMVTYTMGLLHIAVGGLIVLMAGLRSAFNSTDESGVPTPYATGLPTLSEHIYDLSVGNQRNGRSLEEQPSECAIQVMEKYHCEEPGCADLAAGYINYIEFIQCTIPQAFFRFLMGLVYFIWLLFLLHLIETTTNDYFVTSLQLAVSVLKLSPNVAGVTFLAVGNASCDVIASIAAISTGATEVGVGTTVGAGMFVTTAVVAAVTFVADVRLARRSFIRDVVFLLITVVYLMIVSNDHYLSVGENVGFFIIYIIYVAFVAGGRLFRKFLRKGEIEPPSFGGLEPGELQYAADSHALEASAPGPDVPFIADDELPALSAKDQAQARDIFAELDAARRDAITKVHEKETLERKQDSHLFTTSAAAISALTSDNIEVDVESTSSASPSSVAPHTRHNRRKSRSGSFVDDLPTKPSTWTSAFSAAVEGGGHGAFQMPSYHRKKLVRQLAERLRSRGISHMVMLPNGKQVDLAELAVTHPQLAADLAAKAVSEITARAMRTEEGKLTFEQAETAAYGTAALPAQDLIAVLPQESLKPVADMYHRFRKVVATVGPVYSKFMHFFEKPVTVVRHLTIPFLDRENYHRRLFLINIPFSLALMTIVFSTHIIEGGATTIGKGFPVFLLVAICGIVLSLIAHKFFLPKADNYRRFPSDPKHSALLSNASNDIGSPDDAASSSASNSAGGGAQTPHGVEQGAQETWYTPIVSKVVGPQNAEPPKGLFFGVSLCVSFFMSLLWLLIIANELVGTALCFGKLFSVPDVVMGLLVLAIGNSVNDLAASITIAKDGYPTMAIAGAYAGPMFNVLGGIGLPMLIAAAKEPDGKAFVGKDTPVVWMAFIMLIICLVVTLIWVPLSDFRLTHKIGRFLMTWFIIFIVMTIIMGCVPSWST